MDAVRSQMLLVDNTTFAGRASGIQTQLLGRSEMPTLKINMPAGLFGVPVDAERRVTLHIAVYNAVGTRSRSECRICVRPEGYRSGLWSMRNTRLVPQRINGRRVEGA